VRLIGRIAHGLEVVPAVVAIEEVTDVANGLPKIVIGARGFRPQMSFEFRERHFDGVQIRTVGRQEEEPRSLCFQRLCGSRAFVRGQIIENDNVSGLEGWSKLRLDVGIEDSPVHRTVDDPRRCQPPTPQTGNKGLRSPFAKGRRGSEPFSAKTAAAKARHLRVGGCFINKNKAPWLKPHPWEAAGDPALTRLFDICARLLRSQQRFF